MTAFDRTASATYNQPTNPIAAAPRATMTSTGPLFSSLDVVAGIVAAVMTLGPLAMAAFALGRY